MSSNSVHIALPENMQLYFINEKLAPLAEDVYRQLTARNQQDSIKTFLEVRVLDGTPVIEELYLEGQPIVEYLTSH